MVRGKLKRENVSRSGKAVKVIYISAGVLFLFLIAAGVFAGAADRLLYTEEFETGKVEISLQELTGVEVNGTAGKTELMTAGKKLSYAPRIFNEGADCFVRTRICVTADGERLRKDADEYIYGMGTDWIKAGEYYYYKNILKRGESEEVFDGISVPADWIEETAETVKVSVKAEAIQSRNFRPDFGGEMPWGAVMLEEAAAGENTYCASPVTDTSSVSFTSAGKFQCDTEDLFDGFKEVMPGDTYLKEVTVKNDSGAPLDMGLQIHTEESFINEKIRLTVSCGGETVFCGTAAEAACKEKIAAGLVPAAAESEIAVKIEFPPDADNDYTELKDSIRWEITADTSDDTAQTGDPSDLKPFAVTAVLAAAVMGVIAIWRRKGERD